MTPFNRRRNDSESDSSFFYFVYHFVTFRFSNYLTLPGIDFGLRGIILARVGGEKLQKNAFNTGASMRPVEKLGSSPLVRSNGEFSVALPCISLLARRRAAAGF